jgi:hypothetical protein
MNTDAMNAELHRDFATARERFPDIDPRLLWATVKATVATGHVLAKLRDERPGFEPDPDSLVRAFFNAAESYYEQDNTSPTG